VSALLAAAVIVAAAATLVWLRRTRLIVTVRGNSMLPTFRHGQRLLARRVRGGRRFRRGETVVFALTARQLDQQAAGDPVHRVKRVAAVAGDPVPDWLRDALGPAAGERVPPGHVVVAGDNARSQDSRHLGFIDAGAIFAIVTSPRRGG
jgi:signal peptidase I